MPTSRTSSELLRVSEVAELLGQGQETIRRKIAAGILPAVRIADGPRLPLRIPADELEEWLHDPKRPAGEATDLPRSPHGGLEGDT